MLVSKLDDSIEYDFDHYEDPTMGFKPSNKSLLLAEVIILTHYFIIFYQLLSIDYYNKYLYIL